MSQKVNLLQQVSVLQQNIQQQQQQQQQSSNTTKTSSTNSISRRPRQRTNTSFYCWSHGVCAHASPNYNSK